MRQFIWKSRSLTATGFENNVPKTFSHLFLFRTCFWIKPLSFQPVSHSNSFSSEPVSPSNLFLIQTFVSNESGYLSNCFSFGLIFLSKEFVYRTCSFFEPVSYSNQFLSPTFFSLEHAFSFNIFTFEHVSQSNQFLFLTWCFLSNIFFIRGYFESVPLSHLFLQWIRLCIKLFLFCFTFELVSL